MFGNPPDPTTAVALCTGAEILDANPTNLPGLTYFWQRGDTTETITVDRQGIYRVAVFNAAGCMTLGAILAAENRPITELGSDLTICQNTPISPLNAQNPGATYAWTINGVAAGTSQTQSVDTSVPSPPTFEYEVTVTDPLTSCFYKDSIIYTINPIPVITNPVVTNPTSCLLNDGTINLSITGPPNTLFSYFITGPSISVSDINLGIGPIPTATGLDAGTYGITVADQVSGCATIRTATLNDNAFTVSGAANAACDPIGIAVTTSVPQGALTYRVINNATAAVAETGNRPSSPFSTNAAGLASNNNSYIVEVTAGGCTASSAPIT